VSKKKRLVDILKAAPAPIPTQYKFMCMTGAKNINIFGDQLCLDNSNTNDYVTLDEARTAIEWFVEELGGKVNWE